MTERKYLGTRNFYSKALAIALPIMLQQLVQSLVSLIDNFMVSGLGDISMSGVNIAGQVLFVYLIFVNTVCISGGIFLTQYSGAGDPEGMKQAFRFKVIVTLFALIPYFLVCLVFPRQVLSLMLIGNTEASAILDEGVKYMRLMAFVGPQMSISYCIATSLRDRGQVKIPLVMSITATLTNTLFNWLLIYGNLGMPRLEVRGAAVATIIARLVEFILYIIVCVKIKPAFMVKPWEIFKVNTQLFMTILKKSGMVMVSEMAWVMSETVTTAIYNGRGGADVVSGMAASFAIANLFFVAFSGATSATGVILGSSLGAGKLSEAKKQSRWLITGGVILGFIMSGVALLSTMLIPIVYGRLSPGAISIATRMVYMLSVFMPPWIVLTVQLAISRAGGDTAMGAYGDGLMTFVIMLPTVILLSIFTNMGPIALYCCFKLMDMCKVIIFHFWLKRERWLRNLAVPGTEG